MKTAWHHKGRQGTIPGRMGVLGIVLSALLVCGSRAVLGQTGSEQRHHPAPIERRPPGGDQSKSASFSQGNGGRQDNGGKTQPAPRPTRETAGQRHLGEWLEQHQGLSLTQQQQALDREPGFTKLQPQVQQRMNQRLEQLNSMSPDRRDRAIERIEAMERLSPEQRQQVRGAMRELGSLPPDRRRAVAQSFHALQQMPPQQREKYLNSPAIQAQFNGQERDTLGNLVRVAPLLPNETRPTRQR